MTTPAPRQPEPDPAVPVFLFLGPQIPTPEQQRAVLVESARRRQLP